MKQKYTLSIADVELNVTVDESPQTVEYIVGVIDRKMRDILFKSKYCPKTQAALLCALDLCSEKLKIREEADSLKDEIESLNESLKASEDKYSRAESMTVALEKEKARLEIENMKLRAVIEEARRTGSVSADQIDSLMASAGEPAQTGKVGGEQEEKKASNKSRVGSMFDLLTFGDI